jgi:dTDP-L-rhamnose 4-epimerase
LTNANGPILITGGAGFIGSHLAAGLLEQGHKLRIIDPLAPQIHGALPHNLQWLENSNITFMRSSVTDRRAMAKALDGVSMVVHLAAETGTGQSMYEIAHYNAVNTQGTAVLFDILANTPIHTVKRVVLASSRSVYGEGTYLCPSCKPVGRRHSPSPRAAPQLVAHLWEHQCESCGGPLKATATREDDAIKPASIYAATKYSQEQITQIACQSMGIDFAILRLQNVYGQGQSLLNPYTGILSIFSTLIRRDLEIPIYEDGRESRDFVHVTDVVAAMIACLNSDVQLGAVLNVGSGIGTTVQKVAEALTRAFAKSVPIRVTKQYRIGDIRHNFADVTQLKKVLGYQPQITLDEGLAQFVRWVLTQPLPEDQLAKATAELRARKMMG